MSQEVLLRYGKSNEIIVSRKNSASLEQVVSYLKNHGFTETSHSSAQLIQNAQALHNDKGKMVTIAASELFLLLELPGYGGGCLYKTVADEADADKEVQEFLSDEWNAAFYGTIGTSFYLCKDLKEYRIVRSDESN